MFTRKIKRIEEVEGGKFYFISGQDAVFVPEKQGLNEEEAKQIKETVQDYKERIEILQDLVDELLPLHFAMIEARVIFNPLQPMPQDEQVTRLVSHLAAIGYTQTANRQGFVETHLLPSEVLYSKINELRPRVENKLPQLF